MLEMGTRAITCLIATIPTLTVDLTRVLNILSKYFITLTDFCSKLFTHPRGPASTYLDCAAALHPGQKNSRQGRNANHRRADLSVLP
jgi:hypothetical protein